MDKWNEKYSKNVNGNGSNNSIKYNKSKVFTISQSSPTTPVSTPPNNRRVTQLSKQNSTHSFSELHPPASPQLSINRAAFSLPQFNETYDPIEKEEGQTWKNVKKHLTPDCSKDACMGRIKGLFPILEWLPKYDVKNNLFADVIVGFTVAIFIVPQSMGYCLIAQVPPVYGIYSSFFPALMYTLLGTSRHSSVGPFAIVTGVMTGNVIHKVQDELKDTDMTAENIEIALLVGLIMGGILTLGGICRLGFISNYLSEQLISGFSTSASIYVFTSQMRYLTGFHLPYESGVLSMLRTYYYLVTDITECNLPTVIISLITVGILLVFKLFINEQVKKRTGISTPFPIELIIVIGGTLLSNYMDLSGKYNVEVAGHIPPGFPPLRMPSWRLFSLVVGKCIPIAIVGYTITLSVGKIYGAKHGYKVDSNQEMIAMGVTNIWGSLWQCMPAAASLPRSALQETGGGITQVVSLVNCTCIIAVILKLGSLLEKLPKCMLGACIAVALVSLISKIKEFSRYWRVSKLDGSIWLVVFLCVMILDVDYGIYIGLCYSLAVLIYKSQRPKIYLLGCVDISNNSEVYVPINKYQRASEVSGIKIFQFCGPLHFANVQLFVSSLAEKCGVNVTEIKASMKKRPENHDLKVRHIIIDCSMFSHIDTDGVTTLKKTVKLYNEVGIITLLAGCPVHITRMLEKDGFFIEVPFSHSYISIHDAVMHALEAVNTNNIGMDEIVINSVNTAHETCERDKNGLADESDSESENENKYP